MRAVDEGRLLVGYREYVGKGRMESMCISIRWKCNTWTTANLSSNNLHAIEAFLAYQRSQPLLPSSSKAVSLWLVTKTSIKFDTTQKALSMGLSPIGPDGSRPGFRVHKNKNRGYCWMIWLGQTHYVKDFSIRDYFKLVFGSVFFIKKSMINFIHIQYRSIHKFNGKLVY